MADVEVLIRRFRMASMPIVAELHRRRHFIPKPERLRLKRFRRQLAEKRALRRQRTSTD